MNVSTSVIGIWLVYKEIAEKAIKDIYKNAGIEFNFSAKYNKDIAKFIKTEINKLK